VRWLRPEEELLVFETMRSPFREIAKVAALTLMRPVILNAQAQAILRAHLATHESAWVFPNPDGQPYARGWVAKMFRTAARGAGLRDFHFHDLRHHGATMALNEGFTTPILMALGGWKTERMVRRYAAVTDATLRAAAEAVSGDKRGRNGRDEWSQNRNPTEIIEDHAPFQG
jgi:integrase